MQGLGSLIQHQKSFKPLTYKLKSTIGIIPKSKMFNDLIRKKRQVRVGFIEFRTTQYIYFTFLPTTVNKCSTRLANYFLFNFIIHLIIIKLAQ